MPEVSIPPTRGYLVDPVGAGPWPGVVVIHEVFGLNADIRSKADRLAAEGYPDAGHSFMTPKPPLLKPVTALARLDFKPEAAQDAWQRIFAFFGQYLR